MSSRSFNLLVQKMIKQQQYSTDRLRVENRELHQRVADLETAEDIFIEVSGKRFALNASPISPASAQVSSTPESFSPVQKVADAITETLTTVRGETASLKTVEAQLRIGNQALREQVKENQALQEEWLKKQEQLRQALARIEELEKKKTGTFSMLGRIVLVLAGLPILAVLVWQGITSSGNPDPTLSHLSHNAVILDSGILVFRQGLEAILVLAAMTASFVGAHHSYRRPIPARAGLAFLPTVATCSLPIAIIPPVKAPAQDI